MDFTAAKTLLSICGLLREQGIRLVFANVPDDVRTGLDRSGLTDLVCGDARYATVDDILNAFREKNV